jgi:hypothetical protein
MPAGGGEETRVLESINWPSDFEVTEDGIYFIPGGAGSTIQFLRLSTGKIEPVATIGKAMAVGVTLSPDRRTLLFAVREQGDSDLMLVENFR